MKSHVRTTLVDLRGRNRSVQGINKSTIEMWALSQHSIGVDVFNNNETYLNRLLCFT